jgi:hypothetical protein
MKSSISSTTPANTAPHKPRAPTDGRPSARAATPKTAAAAAARAPAPASSAKAQRAATTTIALRVLLLPHGRVESLTASHAGDMDVLLPSLLLRLPLLLVPSCVVRLLQGFTGEGSGPHAAWPSTASCGGCALGCPVPHEDDEDEDDAARAMVSSIIFMPAASSWESVGSRGGGWGTHEGGI